MGSVRPPEREGCTEPTPPKGGPCGARRCGADRRGSRRLDCATGRGTEARSMRPVDFVLDRADNPRRAGSGWLVSCPLPDHGQGRGDKNPSVSVTEGDDGRALVNCRAGCQTEDIAAAWGLKMSDLFEQRNGHKKVLHSTPSKTTATVQPCNLENYAEAKGLPVEFLEKLGLRDQKYQGRPA